MREGADPVRQTRRGRRPKPNKRVPLSVLLPPAMRGDLQAIANETRRSLTGQTELLLKQGIESHFSGPKPAVAPPHELANTATKSASGIGSRAGAFLQLNYPGGGKDERIAGDFGISPAMAKMLRQGRGWTVARLDQAAQLWPGFREFVFAPRDDDLTNRLGQLAAGFERLADQIAELRQELQAARSGRDQPAKARAA